MITNITDDYIFIIFRTWILASKEQKLTLPRKFSGTVDYELTVCLGEC